ncbi:MAG: urease accessory protein UreD [Magnetococcales bacterium]|nr:urease accessory protein UreD [Magnetococcales bacterium]
MTGRFVSNRSAHPVCGRAEIVFKRTEGGTRLGHLYQRNPYRVLFPHSESGEPVTAVLVTTSGGMVGGDRLEGAIEVQAGCEALVMTQAAEKVYRSNGADCGIDLSLSAGRGARLEWLSQECIVFDGARLRRHTRLAVQGDGEILAGELLVFGRTAMGERLRRGLIRDAWSLRRDDGPVVWRDALHMEGDLASLLADPACFDGALAAGSVVHAGPDHLETARTLLAETVTDGIRAAAGRILDAGGGGVTVVRWLGDDPGFCRAAYGRFWAGYRYRVWGRPERLPRLWNI